VATVFPSLALGIFDSGVGGLSLLRRLLDVAPPPWRAVVYLADLQHFPYGPRSAEEVRRFALAGTERLAAAGAGLVAIACHTASSSGVREGLVRTSVPVVDIIGPGSRLVAELAARHAPGRIIVLGTEGTVRRQVWERALRQAGYRGPITGWACPFLANIIEEGRNGHIPRRAVLAATDGLRSVDWGSAQANPDIVVLGCTHYPFAARTIEEVLRTEVLGRPVRVVDPAEALAADLVARARAREGMVGPSGEGRAVVEESGGSPVEVRFLTTGRASHLAERAGQLLADVDKTGPYRLRLDEVQEVTFPDSPV
jgi:glutamate racemase